jgi:serine/threonine protein kinase
MKKSGRVKIADFGTSASAVYLRTTVIGSSYWMAPETIDSSGHDSKVEVSHLQSTNIFFRPIFGPLDALF